jgi:hypothetical protein
MLFVLPVCSQKSSVAHAFCGNPAHEAECGANFFGSGTFFNFTSPHPDQGRTPERKISSMTECDSLSPVEKLRQPASSMRSDEMHKQTAPCTARTPHAYKCSMAECRSRRPAENIQQPASSMRSDECQKQTAVPSITSNVCDSFLPSHGARAGNEEAK